MSNIKPNTKTLKTILSKQDIIKRFELLLLWSFDLFTSSINENETKILESLITLDDIIDLNPDTIYSAINEIKKNLTEHLTRLKQINESMTRRTKIMKVLNQLMDEKANDDVNEEKHNLNDLISKYETTINKLNDVSASKIISAINNA